MNKFCKDCKHCNRRPTMGGQVVEWEGWECRSPKNIEEGKTPHNLVTGAEQDARAWQFCDNARKVIRACGPQGDWYEPIV